MALEDVSRCAHRRHEPLRCHPSSVQDSERGVEPNDEDREPHPEGVHRRRVGEQHRLVGSHLVSAEQSAGAFAPSLRDVAAKDRAAGTVEEYPSHLSTLVRGSDGFGTEWGGQDSNPRHEG